MSTGAARNQRAERAWRRVRLGLLVDLLLFAPAILLLFGGAYSHRGPTWFGVLCLCLVTAAIIRWGIAKQRDTRSRDLADFLGGLATLTAIFALVQQAGRLSVDLYPALYALMALFVTIHRRVIALLLVATSIGFELGLWATTGEPLGVTSWRHSLGHGVWMALFAGLNLGVITLSRWRRPPRLEASTTALPQHQSWPQDQQAAEDGAKGDEDILTTAQRLVQQACQAQAVAFLELQPGSEQLAVTASTNPCHLQTTVDAKVGIPGGVLRSGQVLTANHLRRDYPGTLATGTGRAPAHVMAAPVRHGQKMLGVVVAQREVGPPFDADDLVALQVGTSLIASALYAERAMERVTEAHYELERFFDASRLLNSALTPQQVYESASQALRMITDFELLAITWMDEPGASHRVVHASGDLATGLTDRLVDPEHSLAAMVVKNGHYLPLGCEVRPGNHLVLDEEERLEPLRSLVVLPLRLHDQNQGTLIIGSSKRQAFNDDRRNMAEVIANQVAVSLAKAKVYARVQEMATTDALTKLYNRRAFLERFVEAQARALRSKNPLSLVVLDIDHFKSINDTHGHPIGDTVLAQLGETITRLFRRTDTAARHGGEEFALILEGTDAQGAVVMAERLRRTVSELRFKGVRASSFAVTLSLGVATYPQHASQPSELLSLADQALYEAKRGGRNQTRLAIPYRRRKPRVDPRSTAGDETGTRL